jgi:hypothetical protein
LIPSAFLDFKKSYRPNGRSVLVRPDFCISTLIMGSSCTKIKPKGQSKERFLDPRPSEIEHQIEVLYDAMELHGITRELSERIPEDTRIGHQAHDETTNNVGSDYDNGHSHGVSITDWASAPHTSKGSPTYQKQIMDEQLSDPEDALADIDAMEVPRRPSRLETAQAVTMQSLTAKEIVISPPPREGKTTLTPGTKASPSVMGWGTRGKVPNFSRKTTQANTEAFDQVGDSSPEATSPRRIAEILTAYAAKNSNIFTNAEKRHEHFSQVGFYKQAANFFDLSPDGKTFRNPFAQSVADSEFIGDWQVDGSVTFSSRAECSTSPSKLGWEVHKRDQPLISPRSLSDENGCSDLLATVFGDLDVELLIADQMSDAYTLFNDDEPEDGSDSCYKFLPHASE